MEYITAITPLTLAQKKDIKLNINTFFCGKIPVTSLYLVLGEKLLSNPITQSLYSDRVLTDIKKKQKTLLLRQRP